MNKSIKEIQEELESLEKQRNILELKLSQAIVSALSSVAQQHQIRRVSQHCMIIKFSDLIGNPWNVEFYDWEASVKVCLDYLKDKSPTSWVLLLTKNCKKRVPDLLSLYALSIAVEKKSPLRFRCQECSWKK